MTSFPPTLSSLSGGKRKQRKQRDKVTASCNKIWRLRAPTCGKIWIQWNAHLIKDDKVCSEGWSRGPWIWSRLCLSHLRSQCWWQLPRNASVRTWPENHHWYVIWGTPFYSKTSPAFHLITDHSPSKRPQELLLLSLGLSLGSSGLPKPSQPTFQCHLSVPLPSVHLGQ